MTTRPKAKAATTSHPDKALYQKKAEVAKALAHWARLMIVDALAAGDKSVGDLTALVGSSAATVSRHLSVLRAVGIVEDRRQGNFIIYHLKTPCVTSFFGCAMEVIQTDIRFLREITR